MRPLDDHAITGKITAIPCAFINSREHPLKKSSWLTFKVTEEIDSSGASKLILFGTREYIYKHPECDEAVITVLNNEFITSAKIGDSKYGALFGLMQAQNVIKLFLPKE